MKKLFFSLLFATGITFAQGQPATISCPGSNWTGPHWQQCVVESTNITNFCPLAQGCTNSSQWVPISTGATGAVSSVSGTTNQINCSPTTGSVACGLTNPLVVGTGPATGWFTGSGSLIGFNQGTCTGTIPSGADWLCDSATGLDVGIAAGVFQPITTTHGSVTANHLAVFNSTSGDIKDGGAATTGVTSFTGDGTLSNNSASTGAVTLSLANVAAYSSWGNSTGSSAAPGYTANPINTSISSHGSTSTDDATVGSELTTSGTCTTTGWTGTYPTFTNGTSNTSPIDCTISGIGTGQYYITILVITGASAGSITLSIGSTTVISGLATTGTFTYGPKTTGSGDFLITPTSTYNGTVTISAKLLSPITTCAFYGLDSSGLQSWCMLQINSGYHDIYIGGLGTGTLNFRAVGGLGQNNTAVGYAAMANNTTGGGITAVGTGALENNTTGQANTAFGSNAMLNNVTGASNDAFGGGTLNSNTTGSFNTALGHSSLSSNTIGNNNIAEGYEALFSSTASNNTAIGYLSLFSATSGGSNVGVGASTVLSSAADTNEIVIGASATGAGSNTAVIGNSSITDVYLGGAGAAAKLHATTCVGCTNQSIRTIGATFGDFSSGASALTTTQIACIPTYFSGTITAVELIGSPSGSATVDVRTVTHASFTGPSSTSSITASDIPALSSGTTFTDTTLTGWTTSLSAGTDVCFYLTSPTTVAGVAISVKVAAN